MAEKVFFESCRDYDVAGIERILADGLSYTGARIPRQGTVLVKPNVLGAFVPDWHITTHPAVLEAVVRMLLDNGNKVIVGDSCSIPGGTGRALKKTGIAALAERYEEILIKPFEEFPSRHHVNPDNRFLHKVGLPGVLDDVECIVNLPKLKSHTLTKVTGAVKNLFGCIPGGGKQQAHVTAPSEEEFSHLLLDLYGFIKPKVVLNVMDAVVSLDGWGPGPTGHRNRTGFIGVARDAVALDVACCKAIRFDPQQVFTNRFAVERGLGSGECETNGGLPSVRFHIPRTIPLQTFLFKHVSGLQRRKPGMIRKKCKRCGVCATICPAQCIAMEDYPVWDYTKCIYCYCCHESCPHAAIKLRWTLSAGR